MPSNNLRSEIYKIFYDLGVPSADSGGMEKPYVVEAADQILNLIASKMPEKGEYGRRDGTKGNKLEQAWDSGWDSYNDVVLSILKGGTE